VIFNPHFIQDLKHWINDFNLPAYNFSFGRGFGTRLHSTSGSPAAKKVIQAYWRVINPIILENGWLDKAFAVTTDECNKREIVKFYYDAIKEVAPDIKIMVSGINRHRYNVAKGCGDLWNVYGYNGKLYKEGMKNGERFVLNYIPRPDRSGFDNRKWTLFLWKSGFTGILEWATTYWKLNPWIDPNPVAKRGYKRYGPGNGFLYYPPDKNYKVKGKRVKKNNFTIIPTIRWELLREGIEDYEYFDLLKKASAYLKSPVLKEKAEKLLRKLRDGVELRNAPAKHVYKMNKQEYLNLRVEMAELIEEIELTYNQKGDVK
jgi:hypothetical protein